MIVTHDTTSARSDQQGGQDMIVMHDTNQTNGTKPGDSSTIEEYAALYAAYTYFNTRLFDDSFCRA